MTPTKELMAALRSLLDRLEEESSEPAPAQPLIQQAVLVAPAPYVTISLAAAITGLSEKAIRRKIEEGKWLDGREYRRSPDGRIFISMKAYSAWIESGRLVGGVRR